MIDFNLCSPENTAAQIELREMSNVLDELIQEMSDVRLFVPEANITIQNVVGEGEAASLFE